MTPDGDKQLVKRPVQSAEPFRAFFELCPIGMFECEVSTGRFLRVNDAFCRTVGYGPEALLGMTFPELTHPEDREANWAEFSEATRGEASSYVVEKRYPRQDGAVICIRASVQIVRDEQGRAVRTTAVVEDITEDRRVEARTRELQELTGRLLAEVKERAAAEGRVKQLLGQLVTVQEEQRRRIARELHDTLGQQLTALRLSIDMIKAESEGRAALRGHIERTQLIFDRLNSEVDFLAWELRPAALDMLGLDAVFQTFVQEWGDHFRVAAEYRGRGLDGLRPPSEVETNLYRILQEALQNVHKHAGATRASVLLECRDGQVALVVEDNGCGYDPEEEEAAGTNKGMGVTNMRERAALVGGTLEIESAPGAGTTIFVRVPAGGPDGEARPHEPD